MLKKLANPHAGFLRIDDTAKVSKSTKPNIGASRALLLSSDKHTIPRIFVSRKASHEDRRSSIAETFAAGFACKRSL
jgi:hypothetical protein